MRATTRPASLIGHPVAAAAVLVLVINDHVLKAMMPGTLTGKLSDAAGMIFFPLLLAGLAVRLLGGPPHGESSRYVVISVVATAVIFGLVKTVPAATSAYSVSLAALQWPLRAAASVFRGDALPQMMPVSLVRDPTDLLVLPLLAVPLWLGLRGERMATTAHPRPASPTPGPRPSITAASSAGAARGEQASGLPPCP